MSLIEFDLFTNPENAYSEFRYQLFTELFGNNFQPYVDDDGRPRIGAGIDLAAYMPATASAILGSFLNSTILGQLQAAVNLPYAPGQSAQLQSALNQILQTFATRQPAFPTFFQFTTDSQAKDVLSAAMSSIESNLSSGGGIGIPFSEERVAVASLAHQEHDISNILGEMTVGRDRIQPWFEIRYLERTSVEPTIDQAGMRLYQSAIFELYNNPDTVSFAEAAEVGRAYTSHRAVALAYEDDFDPELIGLGALLGGGTERIADILQPAIKAVADHYLAELSHADELLFATAAGGTFFGDDPGDDFNSAKNDDDLIVSMFSTSGTIIGGEGHDVVISLAGNDRLEGGTGNDNLYGGEGADVLVGGQGNDKLWGGGDIDVLQGGTGNDIYILGGNGELGPDNGGSPLQVGATNGDKIVEAKRSGIDTVIAQVNNGDFNIRNVEKFRLSSDLLGNLSVNLNEFDLFTLSAGDDDLTLVINRLQKKPIDIVTSGGNDTVRIEFEPGIDPSQVLDGKGLTARFRFTDLADDDTIDLTSIGIKGIVTERDHIKSDIGFYLLAPGVKLDVMDGDRIEKTYNNYTNNWFVVKCGDDTPYGPEFMGNINVGHFEI